MHRHHFVNVEHDDEAGCAPGHTGREVGVDLESGSSAGVRCRSAAISCTADHGIDDERPMTKGSSSVHLHDDDAGATPHGARGFARNRSPGPSRNTTATAQVDDASGRVVLASWAQAMPTAVLDDPASHTGCRAQKASSRVKTRYCADKIGGMSPTSARALGHDRASTQYLANWDSSGAMSEKPPGLAPPGTGPMTRQRAVGRRAKLSGSLLPSLPDL